jgi:anti-sigma factor RsiW
MTEPITQTELLSYIDGQLDTADRVTVEAYLASHPEAAASVMEQLRLRNEIRLFLADEAHPPPAATEELARKLERRLGQRSIGLRLRRGLTVACLIGVGWAANAALTGQFRNPFSSPLVPPPFVDEAAEATEAMRLKLAAGDLPYPMIIPLAARHTGGVLPIPDLAAGLPLMGSDLVPWDGGAALLILYDGPGKDVVSLFAAEADGSGPTAPQVASPDGIIIVYWRTGPFVYALSGLPELDLLAIANGILDPRMDRSPNPGQPPERFNG